ncbi:hypothetical protein P8C59_002891 [Phyllachora maydis]|uniref:Calcineurin-like phosphoesterase domain-containing protein n=1 Tax=Phyllachora maydis TaxID=1825666 RepID=A0AAD9HZ51_9PEZI|nr:hypothetical protein P8C59_002891 [Phyllachora maydis]
MEDVRSLVEQRVRALVLFWDQRGRRLTLSAMRTSERRLRQNMAPRRLFSFPHLLVGLWVIILLWGERWVFQSRVERCDWRSWEKWPMGANPHHLVLIADPQLIDPHTYPGRPWPLTSLTYLVTDNYLRRSYNELQRQLRPHSLFFLGDLFDGGREWETATGEFKDPEWYPHPVSEQKFLKSWKKHYGEEFWLQEYERFSDIFIKPWVIAGHQLGSRQVRQKLVASLPGNHDLGFGSGIKLSVRNRFETYFGEGNRVDVIGNHTIVSVDTVSLSAGSSPQADKEEVKQIFQPVEDFLNNLQSLKKKATARELLHQRGQLGDPEWPHRVEDTENSEFMGRANPELLYKNVLTEQDSIKLIEKVGNVVQVFSGDDHDYCEITHAENQRNVSEITVKSISMAMGVSTPGFLMLATYSKYAGFIALSLVLLGIRAGLLPVLNLQRFAVDDTDVLPRYKAKREDCDEYALPTAGYSASLSGGVSGPRDRNGLLTSEFNGWAAKTRNASPAVSSAPHSHHNHHNHHHAKGQGGWGWGSGGRGPKIEISADHAYYDGGKWKVAQVRSGQWRIGIVLRELWATTFRVVWMVVVFWGYLAWKG